MPSATMVALRAPNKKRHANDAGLGDLVSTFARRQARCSAPGFVCSDGCERMDRSRQRIGYYVVSVEYEVRDSV